MESTMNNEESIDIKTDGPYIVKNCEVYDKSSHKVYTDEVQALCRCGRSGNKPFCDGSHEKTGFKGNSQIDIDTNLKNYKGDGIIVHFNPYLCRHAEECVQGCPEVFDPKRKPWIRIGNCDVNKLIETIKKCPSGALSYTHNGKLNNSFFRETKIFLEDGGPINTQGDISIMGEDINHCSLCRCGRSQKKPYCDGSHVTK